MYVLISYCMLVVLVHSFNNFSSTFFCRIDSCRSGTGFSISTVNKIVSYDSNWKSNVAPCTALIGENTPTFLNQFTTYMIFGFKIVKTLHPHELWPKIPNPMNAPNSKLIRIRTCPIISKTWNIRSKTVFGQACKLKWKSACIYDRRL